MKQTTHQTRAKRRSWRKEYWKLQSNRIYSIENASLKLGCCEESVARWESEGLSIHRDGLPHFVIGDELKSFLREKEQNAKRPCQPGEIFCFKCRVPRRPVTESVKHEIHIGKRPRLSGDCAVCGTRMYRAASAKSALNFMTALLTPQTAENRLHEHSHSLLNVTPERIRKDGTKTNDQAPD